ncbi:hypothetical protein Taro_004770, partial [Colocasia esculenta]|nr:hypothetical protein [Colocasia esculenta]
VVFSGSSVDLPPFAPPGVSMMVLTLPSPPFPVNLVFLVELSCVSVDLDVEGLDPVGDLVYLTKMVANGGAPPRGSAAAAASLRRRRTTGGAAGGGGVNTMLQFYTDDATGRKMSPNTVLIMSIGFIAVVALLHVVGKLYLVPRGQ